MMQAQYEDTVAAPVAGSPELASAMAHGQLLLQMLEKEFDALRVQDLDRFESLQPEKLRIFEVLAALSGVGTSGSRLEEPGWDAFRELIANCRDLHRRNEVLISRKLDAIRGTLHTLRGADPTAPVEIYDRLGRIARLRGGRGYEEA